MLYNGSTPTLTESVFKNPPIEYRAAPFWSWNCRVTKELIEKQLLYLKEMGFSGGQMHSRTGMDVPYLSDEFMELVRYCVDESKKDGLLAWIYDEDRFPSGAAGGIVTKTPRFRQRTLLLTTEDHMSEMKPKDEAVENGEPYFCYAYDIVLNSAGGACVIPPYRAGRDGCRNEMVYILLSDTEKRVVQQRDIRRHPLERGNGPVYIGDSREVQRGCRRRIRKDDKNCVHRRAAVRRQGHVCLR